MASLTPLSKGIIGLVVIGAVGYAVWRLAFKDPHQGAWTAPPAAQKVPSAKPVPAQAPSMAAPAGTAPAPSPAPVAAAAPPKPAPVARQSPKPGLSPAENSEAGRKYLHEGNFAQARVHLEQAVKGGDVAAACHLGEMTMKGQGGIQANQDKAAELFRKAQAGGVICFTLAN